MIPNDIHVKYAALVQELKKYSSLIVAFSGGVDSALLLFAAKQALGREKVLAITAQSPSFPERELQEAKEFCRNFGIPQQIIHTDELETINREGNSRDRCYFCKHSLFSRLKTLAVKEGFAAIAEGSNLDDESDYRPGARAIQELGIRSPLKETGFYKAEIRVISKELALPTWDKPAFACLTSRFPYHVMITPEALRMIEQAEAYLKKIGFRLCRVRHYGLKARIEVDREKVQEALNQGEAIISYLKSLGYADVEIDPQGYRTGSMNVFV
jgi:uncharacterized protein